MDTNELSKFMTCYRETGRVPMQVATEWHKRLPMPYHDPIEYVKRILKENEGIDASVEMIDMGDDFGMSTYSPATGKANIIIHPALTEPVLKNVLVHEALETATKKRLLEMGLLKGTEFKNGSICSHFMRSAEDAFIEMAVGRLLYAQYCEVTEKELRLGNRYAGQSQGIFADKHVLKQIVTPILLDKYNLPLFNISLQSQTRHVLEVVNHQAISRDNVRKIEIGFDLAQTESWKGYMSFTVRREEEVLNVAEDDPSFPRVKGIIGSHLLGEFLEVIVYLGGYYLLSRYPQLNDRIQILTGSDLYTEIEVDTRDANHNKIYRGYGIWEKSFLTTWGTEFLGKKEIAHRESYTKARDALGVGRKSIAKDTDG